MDGMEGAVGTVVARLAAALPGKTEALRERYEVDPATQGHLLPDVNTVAPYNRAKLALEEWPAVLVAGLDTLSMLRADQPGTILCKYRLRAFIWVRGEDQVNVESARQRITLAVRELLLERRTMTETAMVDDTTLLESFSELARDDDQATVGASYIQFELWNEETLDDVDRPNIGTVEETRIDTTDLPPHPAL